MKNTQIWTIDSLLHPETRGEVRPGLWLGVRNIDGCLIRIIKHRLKATWLVLIGKADAFIYPDNL